MDANGVKTATPAGHCRLTPLVPLIVDCTFLYHFSVLLMFKLHSRKCRTNLFTTKRLSDQTCSTCSGFQASPQTFSWDIESASVIYLRGGLSGSKVQRRSFKVGLFIHISSFLLRSLTQFFNRAREMEFFKRIIQIPDLPDVSDMFPHIFPRLLYFKTNKSNNSDNSKAAGLVSHHVHLFLPLSLLQTSSERLPWASTKGPWP